jgi:hypothetical protein
MFWKAKYIIADGNIPIVFAEVITHADMARNIGAKSDQIVGAGFVYIQDDGYKVYGESVSLQVKSRGADDERILNKYLGGKQEDDL